MKISIIGSEFVGTALGKGRIELGNEVIFYDVVDKDLPNFTFTKDINHAIESSNISFICVSTPTKENGEIDSTLLEKALAEKENRELMTIWMRGMFDEEEAKRKGFLYKTL